jgi:hypothetical protein
MAFDGPLAHPFVFPHLYNYHSITPCLSDSATIPPLTSAAKAEALLKGKGKDNVRIIAWTHLS